jgi:hypothetical protein
LAESIWAGEYGVDGVETTSKGVFIFYCVVSFSSINASRGYRDTVALSTLCYRTGSIDDKGQGIADGMMAEMMVEMMVEMMGRRASRLDNVLSQNSVPPSRSGCGNGC